MANLSRIPKETPRRPVAVIIDPEQEGPSLGGVVRAEEAAIDSAVMVGINREANDLTPTWPCWPEVSVLVFRMASPGLSREELSILGEDACLISRNVSAPVGKISLVEVLFQEGHFVGVSVNAQPPNPQR